MLLLGRGDSTLKILLTFSHTISDSQSVVDKAYERGILQGIDLLRKALQRPLMIYFILSGSYANLIILHNEKISSFHSTIILLTL